MIPLLLAVLAPVAAALLGENGAGTFNPALHQASSQWKGELPQVQPIKFLSLDQKLESTSKSPFIVPVAHTDKPKRGVAQRGINNGHEDTPVLNNLFETIDMESIPVGMPDFSSLIEKHSPPQVLPAFDNFGNGGHGSAFDNVKPQVIPLINDLNDKVKPQVMPLIDNLNSNVRPQVMPLIDNLNDKVRPQVMPMIETLNDKVKPQVIPLIDNLNNNFKPQVMPKINFTTEPNFDPSEVVKPIRPQVQLPLNNGTPSTVFQPPKDTAEVSGVPLLNILANLTLDCQKSFANITKRVLNQTIGDFKTNFKAWAKKCGKEKEAEALESTSDRMRLGFKQNMTDLLTALPQAMAGLESIEDNENMTVTQKVKAVKAYMAGIKDKNVQKTVQFLEKLFLADTITSIFPDKQIKKGASPSEKSAINAFRDFLTSKRIQKLPKEDKKQKDN